MDNLSMPLLHGFDQASCSYGTNIDFAELNFPERNTVS